MCSFINTFLSPFSLILTAKILNIRYWVMEQPNVPKTIFHGSLFPLYEENLYKRSFPSLFLVFVNTFCSYVIFLQVRRFVSRSEIFVQFSRWVTPRWMRRPHPLPWRPPAHAARNPTNTGDLLRYRSSRFVWPTVPLLQLSVSWR